MKCCHIFSGHSTQPSNYCLNAKEIRTKGPTKLPQFDAFFSKFIVEYRSKYEIMILHGVD